MCGLGYLTTLYQLQTQLGTEICNRVMFLCWINHHAGKVCIWDIGGMASRILKLGNRGQLHVPAAISSSRGLGVPQSRSGHYGVEKDIM
jgi:hypothetical protein